MTEILIYALVGLVVGGIIGALAVRLSQQGREQEKLRALSDLNAERENAARLNAQLQTARETEASLQNMLREGAADRARLEAEAEAAVKRYNEEVARCKQLTDEVEALRRQYDELNAVRLRLEAQSQSLQEKLATQKTEIEKLHEQTLANFRVMANNIMEEKSKAFKELNGESLKTILDPLNRDIESFRKQVTQCYETENKERSSLQEQIRQLATQNEVIRREADKLSSALKGSSKIQGDWGEMVLYNILRQSGLREGSDFEVQKSVDAVGDNSRPDAVLHFPNDGDIIIDSKVSYTAYESYRNATNDDDRRHFANEHLASVIKHVNELSQKDYPSRNSRSPEFVIMFIPIESAFMLALEVGLESGKNLWKLAYDKRVIIMTPTNLVFAVRMLQDMWQQRRLQENVRLIKQRAERIFEQFVAYITDLEDVRASLAKAVKACDSATGRLKDGRNNLVGQFEKLRDLGLDPKIVNKKEKVWKTVKAEAGIIDDDEPAGLPADDDNTDATTPLDE